MRALFPVFALLAFSGVAAADEINAGKLMKQCRAAIRSVDGETSGDPITMLDSGYCAGFIQASTEQNSLRPVRVYCTDAVVTIEQRARVYVAWADKNPQYHHLVPTLAYTIAMAEAFPCSE